MLSLRLIELEHIARIEVNSARVRPTCICVAFRFRYSRRGADPSVELFIGAIYCTYRRICKENVSTLHTNIFSLVVLKNLSLTSSIVQRSENREGTSKGAFASRTHAIAFVPARATRQHWTQRCALAP